MSKFDKRYNMEEKHRGKWQPLMIEGDDSKQKQVLIEPRFADSLNIHAERRKIRYILAEEKTSNAESPMAKAKRIKDDISKAETIEEVDALAKDGTPAVLKAADKKKKELTK